MEKCWDTNPDIERQLVDDSRLLAILWAQELASQGYGELARWRLSDIQESLRGSFLAGRGDELKYLAGEKNYLPYRCAASSLLFEESLRLMTDSQKLQILPVDMLLRFDTDFVQKTSALLERARDAFTTAHYINAEDTNSKKQRRELFWETSALAETVISIVENKISRTPNAESKSFPMTCAVCGLLSAKALHDFTDDVTTGQELRLQAIVRLWDAADRVKEWEPTTYVKTLEKIGWIPLGAARRQAAELLQLIEHFRGVYSGENKIDPQQRPPIRLIQLHPEIPAA